MYEEREKVYQDFSLKTREEIDLLKRHVLKIVAKKCFNNMTFNKIISKNYKFYSAHFYS